eukprot:symbB.v1.2.038009.t1/scaffold5375.1/size55718/3
MSMSFKPTEAGQTSSAGLSSTAERTSTPPHRPARDPDKELALNDTRRFPCFEMLPEKNAPLNFWPPRHWCLMAEIEHVRVSIRWRLFLRDFKGEEFMLHVHITDPVSTMRLEDIKEGHTVAVICAEKHFFLDMTVGIRQDLADTIYVFRCGHKQLVKESVKLMAANKACFACGQRMPSNGLEFGNGGVDDCLDPGLSNHINFPPLALLPSDSKASSPESSESPNTQFYFNSSGEAIRNWIFLFEVCAVVGQKVQGITKFGEDLTFGCQELWSTENLKAGYCIMAIGAFVTDESASMVKVRRSSQIFVVRTETGILGLLNLNHDAEANLRRETGLSFSCQGIVNQQREKLQEMSQEEAQVIQDLVWASTFGFFSHWIFTHWSESQKKVLDSFSDPRLTQFVEEIRQMFKKEKASSTSGESHETKERGVPSDWKAPLRQLLQQHPDGLRCGLIAPKFEATNGYKLDYKAAGFKTLRKLLEAADDIFELSDMPMKQSQKTKPDLIVKLRRCEEATPATRNRQGGPPRPVLAEKMEACDSNGFGPEVEAEDKNECRVEIPRHNLPWFGDTRGTSSLRFLPVRDIGFTHDTIGKNFKDGRPILETLRQLRDGEIMPSAIPQMEVCWQSGSGTNGNWGERWWSYTGNRRLWVFKQLASEGKLQKVEVQVVDRKIQPFRLSTRDGGESVRVRGLAA